MTTIEFYLHDDDSLVVIDAKINDYKIRLALDTGASHTVIDSTALMIAGFTKENAKGDTYLETGKGGIEAEIYEIEWFESLGIIHTIFKICSYDFMANGIFAPIDGVLGLDFFKVQNNKICIDFQNSEITIH